MKQKSEFILKKIFSTTIFLCFLGVNLLYFVTNFFSTFLNKSSNGDEYYQHNLYSVSNFTLEKLFYTPSQLYIFLASCTNEFIKVPRISTRVVSLIACLFFATYLVKKVIKNECSARENIYKTTLFICTIFITNQIFIGTSDFLSIVFIVPPFLIIIENFKLNRINLDLKQSIIVGIFFAIAIATRPTTMVLIFSFYVAFLIMAGIKALFCKENYIIFITGIIVILLINFLPITQKQQIILDIKEVPESTGVNWFQRNYLMAKFWDANKIPNTQWISTQEVIDYKKDNPNFIFPKNQIDLLVKEPGLYFRQMSRMFIKALYTNYRFMYLLFPLLFLSFFKFKQYKIINDVNIIYDKQLFQNKLVIIFHLISIVAFSYLAVKMFEFRWVIPSLILYSYFSLAYLSKFPEKFRFYIYNLSFLSGIVMYIIFFIKNFTF